MPAKRGHTLGIESKNAKETDQIDTLVSPEMSASVTKTVLQFLALTQKG